MQSDDATLVARTLAGDGAAFAQIYDRYVDRLHSFAFGILRDRDEAADATHDTFLRAAERLEQLRNPASLRAWLFSIARHEALRRAKARARTVPSAEDVEMLAGSDEPETLVGRAELAELVWSAAEGLDERDRMLLELSVRQELEPAEVATAIGVSTAHASVLLNRMRERVGRSLGSLVLVRSGARRDCPELAAVLEGWDGKFSVRVRKRVARHAEDCDVCGERCRAALSPLGLFGVAPAFAAPAGLRERVLGDPLLIGYIEQRAPEGPGGTGSDGGGSSGGSGSARWRPGRGHVRVKGGGRRALVAVAAAAVLLAGGATAWLAGAGQPDDPEAGGEPSDQPEADGQIGDPLGAADGDGSVTDAATPDTSATATPKPSAAMDGSHQDSAGAAAPPASPTPAEAPAPSSTGTPPPSTSPSGPVLALGVTTVDLGADRRSATVELSNTGDTPLSWTAHPSAPAVDVEPDSGSIPAGAQASLQIAVDRSLLPEGPFTFSVDVDSDGGDGQIAVHGRVERPPEILRVTVDRSALFPARSRCDPQHAQVTVLWSDESPASAVLHWRQGRGIEGSMPMSPQGAEAATAQLGPFAAPGTVTYEVEVTDDRGNTARSDPRDLPVLACPVR